VQREEDEHVSSVEYTDYNVVDVFFISFFDNRTTLLVTLSKEVVSERSNSRILIHSIRIQY